MVINPSVAAAGQREIERLSARRTSCAAQGFAEIFLKKGHRHRTEKRKGNTRRKNTNTSPHRLSSSLPFLIFLPFGWLLPSRLVPGRRHRHGRPARRGRLLLPREGHVAAGPAPRRPAGRRQVRTVGRTAAEIGSRLLLLWLRKIGPLVRFAGWTASLNWLPLLLCPPVPSDWMDGVGAAASTCRSCCRSTRSSSRSRRCYQSAASCWATVRASIRFPAAAAPSSIIGLDWNSSLLIRRRLIAYISLLLMQTCSA